MADAAGPRRACCRGTGSPPWCGNGTSAPQRQVSEHIQLACATRIHGKLPVIVAISSWPILIACSFSAAWSVRARNCFSVDIAISACPVLRYSSARFRI